MLGTYLLFGTPPVGAAILAAEKRRATVKMSTKDTGMSLLVGVAVLALFLGYWWAVSRYIHGAQDRALFGDMFGGLAALFSGLAFAGLIVAIVLQSRELGLQRDELEATRHEMTLARDQYAKSAEAQTDLVEKQLLTARIQGVAAIVQGRYQYAAAFGANSAARLRPAEVAEDVLIQLLDGAGLQPGPLQSVRFPHQQ